MSGARGRRRLTRSIHIARDLATISRSDFFDAQWYRTAYPDVANARIPALLHYYFRGSREGRAPSPQFSTGWYLERYPDVAAAEINPLVHFIRSGRDEGRLPRPADEPSPVAGRASAICMLLITRGANRAVAGVANILTRTSGVDVLELPVEASRSAVDELLADHDVALVLADGSLPDWMSRRFEKAGQAVLRVDTDLAGPAEYSEFVDQALRRAIPGYRSVSVIVPNYNYARYLPGRIASVFGQRYPICQLIVLDDASTDDSVDVLGRLRQATGRDFDVVVGAANSGNVFEQWRRGAELATGEFIWIAEADDLASPDFLSDLMAAVDDSTVLAFCDSRQIDEHGTVIGSTYGSLLGDLPINPMTSSFRGDGADFARDVLAVKNVIYNVSGVVLQRNSLLEVFRRSFADIRSFGVAGDWRIYSEMLLRPGAGIAYVHRANNDHRRHASSVTHSLDVDRHLDEFARVQQYVAAGGVTDEVKRAAAEQLAAVRAHLKRSS